ncbi:glycosyltransferase family 4 protein [Bifidobacterium dentium]|uniref:glycosyltransferase family 4 protein n=1 Tax=Bifidobacterium TaxID=1678 RepID=UPI001485A5B4|nr:MULTISPECIES: glycosyltransferase family 4 protein [Bifidobacterium]MBF9696803.1 glycosyltransferase family 4 protein [Bifidobacterium dentium]MBF9712963.1 glycosyltransferase family 4 protein [Bifidobacterium dentium]MBF9714924.1 glycosyltransferase family 4 protein [Bifidobacterium dentium]MBF9718901.1 glycosyltransferase family 4 protein [Bifidobacterium dentium]
MDTLYFVNRWEKDNRRYTWSGTPFGLWSALSQEIRRSISLDLEYGVFMNALVKTIHGVERILSIDGCELAERYFEAYLQNCFFSNQKETGPVIAFGEAKTSRIKDTYYFIDCSVDYAKRCFDSSTSYARYVPLSKIRKHSLIDGREKLAISCYKQCKGIFTMGQWLADDLVKNTGLSTEKVHCVGGGVNVNRNLIDSSKRNGRRFLFVGKDFERKNGALVVEAFIRLNTEHANNYELYIAGPREWPLAGEIPSGVHFLGLKTSKELVEYYNLCDVFVMPSLFEAYGLVFAEALVFGLPIVARDAFAMRDFVQPGENGYLLRSNSAEDLAKLMYNSISDLKMRNRIIDMKEEYADRYSWDSVANRMISVMRNDGYEL